MAARVIRIDPSGVAKGNIDELRPRASIAMATALPTSP
jgi:hypothetical protein